MAPPATDAARPSRRIRGLSADERRQRRCQQLLDAALDRFAADGYAGTSIEQICQAAYVGTKGFYECFDGKEACYLALLRRVSAAVERAVADAAADAPADEHAATALVVDAFARALVDDPRVAMVTFGHASGISPVIEEERRRNRRRAATFVVAFWQRFDFRPAAAATGPAGTPSADAGAGRPPAAGPDRQTTALGLVGGLFEMVADWLHDVDPSDDAARAQLVDRLTEFALLVGTAARAGG